MCQASGSFRRPFLREAANHHLEVRRGSKEIYKDLDSDNMASGYVAVKL